MKRNDPCWCGSGKKYKKCHMDFDDRIDEIKFDKDVIDMPDALIFAGKVDGFIAKDLKGAEGFGYDPIFAVKEYSNISKNIIETYSSLGQKVKNSISHRAKAISAFVDYLEKNHNI